MLRMFEFIPIDLCCTRTHDTSHMLPRVSWGVASLGTCLNSHRNQSQTPNNVQGSFHTFLTFCISIRIAASVVDPLHLQYFKFAGRMIALALRHKIHVGVLFDRTLFLQLAGRPITLDDIADADPSLHASCKKILEMDPTLVDSDVLGLRFIREVDVLGLRTVTELFPGGKDTSVNSENLYEYINLLIQDSFVNCTRRQLGHFAEGFSSMLGETISQTAFFESLNVEDFDEMLGGSKDSIDVKQWRAHTHHRGYKENDGQVNWFWKVWPSL